LADGLDAGRIAHDLRALGVAQGGLLMVHASLSALGPVAGGAGTVIAGLLEALGPEGTLVMPAFRDGVTLAGRHESAPREVMDRARATLAPYDPATTPTNCGAIAERFRRLPGVRRSAHPVCSVAALGPLAQRVVHPHAVSWGTGPESPFARLTELDAQHLLLGVGFDRLSLLHHAECRVPHGRRKTRVIPEAVGCLLTPDAGNDGGVLFPRVGAAFVEAGGVAQGRVGAAPCHLIRAQPLIAFAVGCLAALLEDG
jgi:aminoglycoside 3-N-acetyltransferase